MISRENIEATCLEVGNLTADEMAHEFERFFKAQPSIAEFVMQLTGDSGQKIQESSLFLSFMVVKIMQKASVAEVPVVQPAELDAAFHNSEGWIERMNDAEGGHNASSLVAEIIAAEDEPNLMGYVVGEINQAQQDGSDLEEEEKGEIFFVLRTVISSLSQTISKGVS